MKTILLFITMFALLAFPKANFGQVAPTLGAASSYALFTGTGASFSNIGAATIITGDIGSNASPITGFLSAQVVGATNAQNATSAAVAANVGTAFSDLNQGGSVLGVTIVNGQVIKKGVWSTGAAATLSGTVTLDGEGDPNAIFIIRIGGALAIDPASNVILINSASLCNVYWQVNGAVSLGNSSVFRGTVIASGIIELLEASSLLGRGLSTAGAIKLHNNVVTNSDCSSLPAAVAGPNISINLNSSTQIGAANVAGSSFSWSSVPAGFTSTLSNPIVTPLVTTTYKVVETIIATGISNTHSVVVTVNPLPAAVAGVNRSINPNTSTQIGAADVPGSTFSWSSVPGEFTSTVSNPTVSPLVTTTYTVVETITATGATNTHSVVVTVNPLPAAVAGADRAICVNASTQIGAATVPGSTYSWSSIPAGFTSTVSNPTVSPLVTTTYTVVETITATGTTNSHNVIVTVNPIPTAIAGNNRTICMNTDTQIGAAAVIGSTYSWSSVPAGFTSTEANPTVSPELTTTYTVTETIAATGCTNSHSVVITTNPKPAAVAGAAREICVNSSTILGAAAVNGSTYNWSSVPAGFTSTVANPTVAPLITTTYTVIETITATGCTNSNSVVVKVNSLPDAVSGADRTICLKTGTQIGAAVVTGNTYNWSSVPTGFSSTEANPTVKPLVKTTYTVVETVTASGCINSNSVVVSLNSIPDAVAGADRTICPNTDTQIGAAAVTGSTYSWISVPSGFTSTEANPTVSPLVTTTYIVTETSEGSSCTNSNNVVVIANLLPAALAGADRTICLNTGTQIGSAAVTGSTYKWSSAPAGFTSTAANPTVAPLVTTTYTVSETITATGCTNSNSVVVSLNPRPAAVAGADRSICINTDTKIGATAVTGSTYSWSSVPAGFTSTEANPTVSPLVTTTYTVTETTETSSCKNSNSVVVTVNSLPTAVAGIARTICLNTSTTLGAAANSGSTYSWSSTPAGFTSTVANPTVTPLETTTYTVVETYAASGCTNSNSVIVKVNPIPAAVAGVNRTICLDENTRIGAVAIAGNTYSWSSAPAGFTSTEANPIVTPKVTTIYTVIETSVASDCQNTNSITVSLNAVPNIITEPVDQTACVGNSVSFSVTATGTELTYQWRKGTLALTNGGNISGANSAVLTINPVSSSDKASNYNVVISGTCSKFDTSKDVSLVVNAAPSLSTAVCVGSSVSFSASAIGTGLTYQWRKGDVNLTDGGNISGANSATLSINPVTLADASSDYNVLINGACSPNATALHVALLVNPALNIIAEPIDQTACAGDVARFSMTAEGAGLTYQWRKGEVNLINGGNISGATSSTLMINPVKTSDVASNYNVVITGACSPMSKSKDVALVLCIPVGNANLDAGDTTNAVTIYPNPFTSSIDIKVNDASKMINYELKIFNILGEEVMNTLITKDITTLKTSNLPSGIYMYEVNSNNQTIQSGKLISKQ